MKIVYLVTYYEGYLRDFYRANPDFGELSFADQRRRLVADHFGMFGSWTNQANRLGHEATLIVPNCRPMQRQWAREQGLPFDEGSWLFSTAIQQIRSLCPDVLLLGSIFEYYGAFLKEVRPHCKALVTWISCPIPSGLDLTPFSLILSSAPHFVQRFRLQGLRSEVLPAAFDPEVLASLPRDGEPDVPFSFVGGLTPAHGRRRALLNELVARTPLRLWGYGIQGHAPLDRLRRLFSRDPLERRYCGTAWGLGMYSVLARSRITFNAHIDVAGDYVVNMRLYEATGVGTLLLTDHGRNLPELFVPGAELVTYDSAEEAAEKVAYYLEHERERREIAQAGQRRTLRDYTYERTTAQMVELFRKQL